MPLPCRRWFTSCACRRMFTTGNCLDFKIMGFVIFYVSLSLSLSLSHSDVAHLSPNVSTSINVHLTRPVYCRPLVLAYCTNTQLILIYCSPRLKVRGRVQSQSIVLLLRQYYTVARDQVYIKIKTFYCPLNQVAEKTSCFDLAQYDGMLCNIFTVEW